MLAWPRSRRPFQTPPTQSLPRFWRVPKLGTRSAAVPCCGRVRHRLKSRALRLLSRPSRHRTGENCTANVGYVSGLSNRESERLDRSTGMQTGRAVDAVAGLARVRSGVSSRTEGLWLGLEPRQASPLKPQFITLVASGESRLEALFSGHKYPICSLVTPVHPDAALPTCATNCGSMEVVSKSQGGPDSVPRWTSSLSRCGSLECLRHGRSPRLGSLARCTGSVLIS